MSTRVLLKVFHEGRVKEERSTRRTRTVRLCTYGIMPSRAEQRCRLVVVLGSKLVQNPTRSIFPPTAQVRTKEDIWNANVPLSLSTTLAPVSARLGTRGFLKF